MVDRIVLRDDPGVGEHGAEEERDEGGAHLGERGEAVIEPEGEGGGSGDQRGYEQRVVDQDLFP